MPTLIHVNGSPRFAVYDVYLVSASRDEKAWRACFDRRDQAEEYIRRQTPLLYDDWAFLIDERS